MILRVRMNRCQVCHHQRASRRGSGGGARKRASPCNSDLLIRWKRRRCSGGWPGRTHSTNSRELAMSDKLRKSKVRKIENVCLRCRRAVIEGLETPGYEYQSLIEIFHWVAFPKNTAVEVQFEASGTPCSISNLPDLSARPILID